MPSLAGRLTDRHGGWPAGTATVWENCMKLVSLVIAIAALAVAATGYASGLYQ